MPSPAPTSGSPVRQQPCPTCSQRGWRVLRSSIHWWWNIKPSFHHVLAIISPWDRALASLGTKLWLVYYLKWWKDDLGAHLWLEKHPCKRIITLVINTKEQQLFLLQCPDGKRLNFCACERCHSTNAKCPFAPLFTERFFRPRAKGQCKMPCKCVNAGLGKYRGRRESATAG